MSNIVEKCPICGVDNVFILRKQAKHWRTGQMIYPRNGRALKIRLSGCHH